MRFNKWWVTFLLGQSFVSSLIVNAECCIFWNVESRYGNCCYTEHHATTKSVFYSTLPYFQFTGSSKFWPRQKNYIYFHLLRSRYGLIFKNIYCIFFYIFTNYLALNNIKCRPIKPTCKLHFYSCTEPKIEHSLKW